MEYYEVFTICPACHSNQMPATTYKYDPYFGNILERRCCTCGYTWNQKPFNEPDENSEERTKINLTTK